MSSFSFLHAADIHLDSPLLGLSRYDGVPADEVRDATRAAFDRLIATAIDRQVDFVILAGDLYDGDWKDMGTGLYFSAAMGRLGRAGIPVYLLAGNHDAASVITRELPPIPGLHRFSARKAETHVIPDLSVALHGRSFAARVVTENLAASYPPPRPGFFNIGVLHTSLGGYAAHETYAPCTIQELVGQGYAYWALGHVHEFAVLHEHPHIIYPGNLQGRSIREQGSKGAVLVEVRDGDVHQIERLELDVVRWARVAVDATALADREALQDRIGAALRDARADLADGRKLIVRLVVSGETPLHGALQDVSGALRDDVRSIANALGGDLWVEKLQIATTPPSVAGSPPPALQGADEITALLSAADDDLRTLLQDEFSRFLAGVAERDPESLLSVARNGDWQAITAMAAAALRARLTAAA